MILTGVTTRAEFREMREHIHYDFLEDNHFTELKNAEIMGDRLRLLGNGVVPDTAERAIRILLEKLHEV